MLTPTEIHNKEFQTRMRGYDKNEVDAFMRDVEKELEDLIEEKNAAIKELNLAKDRIQSFEEIQDMLNQSLLVAQDAAENIKKDARKEADGLLEEAEDNADRLLCEAVSKAQDIDKETEYLREQSRVFRERLQSMVESHLELLTAQDWQVLLEAKNHATAETKTIRAVEEELEKSDSSTQGEVVDKENN